MDKDRFERVQIETPPGGEEPWVVAGRVIGDANQLSLDEAVHCITALGLKPGERLPYEYDENGLLPSFLVSLAIDKFMMRISNLDMITLLLASNEKSRIDARDMLQDSCGRLREASENEVVLQWLDAGPGDWLKCLADAEDLLSKTA